MRISYLDFEEWYLSSEVYIISFIKRKFDEFDKDKNAYINVQELESLLKRIVKELLDDSIVKEELDTAIQILTSAGGSTSKEEFVDWFRKSLYYEQAKQRNQ